MLGLATLESDNPDLRDRGYIYWRLLSTDPAAAKEVVLAEKPLISEETDLLEPSLLDELICNLGVWPVSIINPHRPSLKGATSRARLSSLSQLKAVSQQMKGLAAQIRCPPLFQHRYYPVFNAQ